MQVSWWCRKRAEDSNRIEIKNIGAVGENTSTKNGVLRLLLGLGGTPGGSKAEFCSRKCDAQKSLNEIAAGERHPLSTGEPVGLLHLPIVNYTISTTQHYNIIQLGFMNLNFIDILFV